MYKKVILVPCSTLIGMIILNYIDDIFTELLTYYLLSLFLIALAIILYPIDFKFKHKADFTFLIVLGIAIFNIVNLIILKDFSSEINYINILTGAFGILLLFFRKKK